MFAEENEPEEKEILMIQVLGTIVKERNLCLSSWKGLGLRVQKEQKLEEQGWMLAGWYI